MARTGDLFRGKLSMDQMPAASVTGCMSRARRAMPTPQGCGEDSGSRRPPPPPPPPGRTDPRRRREHSLVPFLWGWTASDCHRGPYATVTEARPASTQPPPGSASRDPGLTFPGGSALLAHSPQPGPGAARRSVPVAGPGRGRGSHSPPPPSAAARASAAAAASLHDCSAAT